MGHHKRETSRKNTNGPDGSPKMQNITVQEKKIILPIWGRKKRIISKRPHLEYLSKKSESRSKRKDKVARSLDENMIPLLKRRVSSSSIINKTRDGRMKSANFFFLFF
jgi:hypothetical protein